MADREENKILLWMFKNDKQNDRQPDYTGPGRISKDVLKEIVEAYKKYGDGDSLTLRCASWNRDGKNGPYLFVTIEPEKPRDNTPDASDIPF